MAKVVKTITLNKGIVTAVTGSTVDLADVTALSAANKLVGSITSGVVSEITLGSGLVVSGGVLSFSLSFTDDVPVGTIDGTNPTFFLNHTPYLGSLNVYTNGLRLKKGSGNDYVYTYPITLTFQAGAIPHTGDTISASYAY